MTATAEQITRLRRMAGETNSSTYADADLQGYIERHPMIDAAGQSPWLSIQTPTGAPDNPDWTATYDLNAAAGDIWDEKAAALAPHYDFNADGGQYSRSQAYQQAMAMARHYRSRRSPKTITMRSAPWPSGEDE